MKGCQADEELEIWILFDLLEKFFIREPQACLDDQSPSAMRNSLAGAPNPLQNWDA